MFVSFNIVGHIINCLLPLPGVMTTSLSSTVVSEEGLEAYSSMIWTLLPRRKFFSLCRAVPKPLCLVTFPLWRNTAMTPSHQRRSNGSSFGEDGEYWRSKRIPGRWMRLARIKCASSSWLWGLCPEVYFYILSQCRLSLHKCSKACQRVATLPCTELFLISSAGLPGRLQKVPAHPCMYPQLSHMQQHKQPI